MRFKSEVSKAKKGSEVADPITHIELLARDVQSLVSLIDTERALSESSQIYLKLNIELSKWLDAIRESFARITIKFDHFRKIDPGLLVKLDLKYVHLLIYHLLVGVSAVLNYPTKAPVVFTAVCSI